MAKLDPAVLAHLEWLGFVQPTGLVVSAPALVRAGAILDRRDAAGQTLLEACLEEREFNPEEGAVPWLPDFEAFAKTVLGWSFSAKGYGGTADAPLPSELELRLPDYGETLRPDFAVRELSPEEGEVPWQLLIQVLDPGADLDKVHPAKGKLEASPHGRMERLLRRTGVPAGLLFNGRVLRLVSAPRGESSGWLDFRVADMAQTSGRPISTALRLLLSQTRLLALPKDKRLAALLDDSRKFQNEVSERLAEQVLHGLYELLRGLQSAHDQSKGELLRQQLAEHPDEVYRSMLTVILRLVFLLYSEERDMLPAEETFLRHYSLSSLYARLRADAALYPDTMNQRYGAWAQLVVLFRMVHDGAECGDMRLPRRHGVLFDPDRFPFLEGRTGAGTRQIHERIEPPLIPDGTIYRALEKLLVLDGERISYRALDVEQIGSVYETMMGFRLEIATGRSIAIRAGKKHGAPSTIDLDALLAEESAKRKKWVLDRTDRKLTDKVNRAVRGAESLEDLHVALDPVLDREATPDLVPLGAMVLQPSEERRRSGSHYTPRSLTEPIVRRTLAPILSRLRHGKDGEEAPPTPEQILDLKVCDPAMGSGAFLVEACRQLGDALIESWHAHDALPELPADEDEVIFARRLVAQRCLYGVDRNPVAVDLAKVSLWLVTLAREHALTFVDHALRHGDSLVGFSRQQMEAFHWGENKPPVLRGFGVRDALDSVLALRGKIRQAGEEIADWELRDLWNEAQFELGKVRLIGDLALAAFFEGKDPREREAKRGGFEMQLMNGEVERYRGWLEDLRHADPPLAPFHWELEFPEVFERDNPGFDVIVGNPPFQGGRNVSAIQGAVYSKWLLEMHAKSSGGADLVAHFFRRAFNLLRQDGSFGLIATNTIAQGDTRGSGLRWICNHGGDIYWAHKRIKWPGLAAVVVSVVHTMKGEFGGVRLLDNREVEQITAFLFHRGGHDDPSRLAANAGKSWVGSYVLGIGFTFDDTDKKGVASSLAEMDRLMAKDANNQEVIFPYIGGAEVNNSPTHAHHRHIINFGERSEAECREQWPDLVRIVEERVRPDRITKNAEKYPRMVHEWWKYWNPRPELHAAIDGLERVLVCPGGASATKFLGFAKLGTGFVYSQTLCVFALPEDVGFCLVQSRVHDVWCRFFGATLEDRLRYNSSDVFETFPFPAAWQANPTLEAAGQTYYDFRAEVMVRKEEGLTRTYNRFHDPEESDPDIERLRGLHAAMDRAVLHAYGWDDLSTDCEFLLDYEIDEENWSPRKKKPYRFRWPEETHNEVLARLLELNTARGKAESLQGALL
jgi:Eco57I restriction-modification methylase/restriction-modification enzyme MmeI-like protein